MLKQPREHDEKLVKLLILLEEKLALTDIALSIGDIPMAKANVKVVKDSLFRYRKILNKQLKEAHDKLRNI